MGTLRSEQPHEDPVHPGPVHMDTLRSEQPHEDTDNQPGPVHVGTLRPGATDTQDNEEENANQQILDKDEELIVEDFTVKPLDIVGALLVFLGAGGGILSG